MTITEMHRAFDMELDKSSAIEMPSFLPEEKDFWLNMAIRSFVKNRYRGKQDGVGFEEISKRTMDLSTLVNETTLDVTADTVKTDSGLHSYLADLPNSLWFIVGEEVDIIYKKLGDTENTTKRQGVTQCTASTYRSHIDDPHSEHRLHYEEAKPLRLIYQQNVELIGDLNYTIGHYYVRYIKKPAVVLWVGISSVNNIDCDLPEHTHDEVVKLAANMVLENIEQPRYQSHMVELNKVE
jgi:hypothetical protein